jgi:CubicO group peptidase (beta-lactamase class C family)
MSPTYAPILALALAATVCQTVTPVTPADPADPNAVVIAVLAKHFERNGPGAIVLVAERGRTRLVAAYGMADVGRKVPLTSKSVFDLASVSKQFTATAVLLLAGDGKLSLEDPVRKHVPDFAVPVVGRPVTVADLVHHVSGLADYTGDDWQASDETFAKVTTETHLAWLNKTRPHRAPGKRFEYNNSNYALLALVVERVAKMPFSRFLEQRVFAPAGMTSTRVYDRLGMEIPNAAVGYAVDGGAPRRSSSPSQITGDGNVFTSIEDMARWDAALAGERVLSERLKRIAWTGGQLDDGDEHGYGFGWVTDSETSSVSHSGSWYGTSTYIVRYLDSGLTIVVLSNDENSDAEAIAGEIEAALD